VRILERCRRRFDDLTWRATAVVDRVRLRSRLPAAVATTAVRFSRYVPVRDLTKIAVDVYRPARRHRLLDGPLPVVWTFERYHRARMEHGRVRTRLQTELGLDLLVRHGYVVGVADVRGSGASFGSRDGLVTEQDRWDAYDITEWFAAQPWSNGRVAMFGKSFMALTQYLGASTAPPHLVAICPEKTLFDLYSFAYSGGVFRDDYAREWARNTADLDRARPAAPVDDDVEGHLRAAAIQEHECNQDVYQLFSHLPFQDSTGGADREPVYARQSPSRHRAAIGGSGVAVYQLAGWNDMWPRDALLWHSNLSNPRKLVIGPWAHTHDSGWKLFAERLRWFDYWLKGVPNGVMDDPPIRYYTMGAPRGTEWRTTDQWPLPGARPTSFYFGPPRAGHASAGGSLSETAPSSEEGEDSYTVDYSTTSGMGTRWKNGYGLEFGYPDMAGNDRKALTYTTPPLREDVEVTGHPVLRLWLSANVDDVDVFAYLEEVRRSGYSEYVTEGVLRASHRAEAEAPYDNLGLPYHASRSSDIAVLASSQPVALAFDLHPISRVFRRGRRLRLAITGADADNAATPILDRPPRLSLCRNARFASHLVLPVIPPRSTQLP
jgi:putative CocE/NonD family hydrolase